MWLIRDCGVVVYVNHVNRKRADLCRGRHKLVWKYFREMVQGREWYLTSYKKIWHFLKAIPLL